MSQHHKLIWVILVAALGGMWIGYSLDSREQKNQGPPPQNTTSLATTEDNLTLVSQLQMQVQQLQSENVLLQQQLQALSEKQGTNIASQKNVQADQTNRQLQHELRSLEMEKVRRKIDDFSAWAMDSQKADSSFDLNNELTQRFEQERRDSVWAEQQEHHYQQLFSTQEELRDFAWRNVECRSTQCEVTVSVTNSEQSRLLLQTLSSLIEGSMIVIAADENNSTNKFYIGRDEKSFEFY